MAGTLISLDLAALSTALGTSSLDFGEMVYVRDINSLVVSGTTAGTLSVVSLADPAAPVVSGSITSAQTAGITALLELFKSVVIASSTSTSISLVDVSVPTAPVILNTITDAAFANVAGLANLSSGYAFAACVTDTSIKAIATTGILSSLTDATRFSGMIGLEKTGLYLITVGNSRLTVIDASNPLSLAVIGTLFHADLSGATSFKIDGDYVGVATSAGKIVVCSIFDLTVPTHVHTYTNVPVIGTTPSLLIIAGIYYVLNPGGDLLTALDFRTDTQVNFDNYLEDVEAYRFDFDGDYHTDSRICLDFYGPATLLALTYEVDDTDNPPRS